MRGQATIVMTSENWVSRLSETICHKISLLLARNLYFLERLSCSPPCQVNERIPRSSLLCQPCRMESF